MNTSQGALHFGAGIDLTEWRRNVDTMRRDIIGLNRDTQTQTREMDSAFKSLSIGIASYFSVAAIKSFVMELINVRGEFQKTEIAFSTMLRSEAKAADLMKQMVDLAAKTPFGLQEVSAGAKQLLAFQVPANEVVDILTRMGNIAAGLGVPLSRINLVYGQVKAKGRLMGDDLRQFTEAGIPMVAELAAKFGKTTAEISNMVSAGKIGFKDVQDVLFNLTNEGGMFFNLMEKQSKSVSGQIANMGDVWDQMLNNIGESQDGMISDGIKGLTYLIEHYQEVGKAIITLVEIYGTYRAALIFTSALQTRMAAPAVIQGFTNLINIIRGVTVAQTALNTASLANPYVLLATLIASLIAVTYNYRQEIGELLGIIEETTAAQKVQEKITKQYNDTFGKGVAETKSAIESLIYTIRSEYSSLEQREAAYKKLIAIDSSFINTLDNQFRATSRLTTAFDSLIQNLQKYAMAQAEVAVRAEAFKNFAETEMQLGINQVKMEDAEAQIEKLANEFKAGKITMEQYADATKKINWRQLKGENIELNKVLKEQRTEKQLISRIDQKQIKDLQKGNKIIKSQLAGGKVQGKILTEEGRKALDAQLRNNENILKLRFGIEPEIKVEPEAVKSWAQDIKDKIEALQAEQFAPGTSKSRYFQLDAQIKQLNEMLNPKKLKVDNRQIAELLPMGSIIELERRAQLINDAVKYAVDGQVRLRKLDKFGQDKDKKGNPYFTGEIITPEEAEKRVKEIYARIKKLQKKSFDEELQETERQWKIRYQLASHYGDEIAKSMFPKLKGDSYYSEINNLFKDLDGKYKAGVITEEELDNWSKLKTILSGLNGTKDPFTQFTEGIDKDLSKLKTAAEKVEYLNGRLYKLNDQEIASGFKAEIFNQLNAIKQEEQKQYQQLLEEHKSYNDRKIDIERDTAIAIKKIREDQSLTPEAKKTAENSIDKRSKEEISQLAVDELTKSQAWMALYGNIDELTAYQMQVLLEQLEAKKDNLAKVLTPVDFKILLKNLKETRNQISEENPFLGLLTSVKELFSAFGDESEEAGERAFSSFERASDGIKGTLKAAKGIISTLAPAREYMSDAANDAMDTIEQVTTMGIMMMQAIDSTVTAVKSALDNASWSNWITAIISIIYTVIRAVVSLFTWIAGNKRKKLEKEIKSLQGTLDSLEDTYTNLAIAAEKAFGAMKYEGQRELIKNLQEQQKVLEDMKNTESKKKKADKDKINDYNQQQQDNLRKIQEIKDAIIRDVLQIDVVEMAANIGDALVDAFGKGVDGIDNINKAFDEMIKNIMRNQLNKVLEQQMAPIYDNILKAAGFDKDGNGTFNGLTKDEIDDLRAQVLAASTKGKEFIDAYSEIFKDLDMSTPEGIKGSIKGMTEKTAGALEAQFNAIRMNMAEAVKYAKINHTVQNVQTALLSQIEVNTRRLHNMDKTLTEMNSKMKKSLAGIP